MKLNNPFTQYPKYAVSVVLKDGRILGKSGVCVPEIDLSVDEEDVAVITLIALNNKNEEQDVKMYHDGTWKAYDAELVDRLLNPKPKPKPKPKSKSKPKSKPKPKLEPESESEPESETGPSLKKILEEDWEDMWDDEPDE